MKVQLHYVGPPRPNSTECFEWDSEMVLWPEGWPLPRAGERITMSDQRQFIVHGLHWFPDVADGESPTVRLEVRGWPSPRS